MVAGNGAKYPQIGRAFDNPPLRHDENTLAIRR